MKKLLLLFILLIFIAPSTKLPETNETKFVVHKLTETMPAGNSDSTEYWALLIAVGRYTVPEMDRPSMLVEVERLYKTLLVSNFWNESHVKVLTAENATHINIIKAFKWLDEMEDENDISLIYITTHGFPILFDLPPFDEKDGMDEALATYRGFLPFSNPWSWEPLANPFAIITDDELNYFLNRLESKGICLIVDSCHSGGFNDNWSYAKSYDFAKELAKELKGRNRVVLTSVREEDLSYGSIFSHYLIDGFKGYADKNGDGFVSAEEAFYYAKPLVINATEGRMVPQIFDDFEGELILTEKELPPSMPVIKGNDIGKTNTTTTFSIYAVDPEEDRIKYYIDWGDGNAEYTDFYSSGEEINVSHIWKKEGTFEIKVKAIDERGAESEFSYYVVTMTDTQVDQRQVEMDYAYLVNNTRWLAQSFVPSYNKTRKIEIALVCWTEGYDLILSIRDDLNGEDLVTVKKEINPTKEWQIQWISFNINTELEAGKKYYIVCRSSKAGWGIAWAVGAGNPYEKGEFYTSNYAGNYWSQKNADACFVTYS